MRILFVLFFALVNLFSQELLSQKVLDEINSLSNELEQKTGIKTGVLVSDDEKFIDLKNKIKFTKNYAVIVVSIKEKKIAVISDLPLNYSSITKYYYLKYGFLPTQGAILPILTQERGKDLVNAAILNGFAELVDIIADSKNVKLEHSFGKSNEIFINVLRGIFYFSIVVFIFVYIKNKLRSRS